MAVLVSDMHAVGLGELQAECELLHGREKGA